MDRNINRQNYKNAFNCKKCPGNSGPDGCPDWIAYTERDSSGNERYTEECGRQAWPKFLGHTLAAANRSTAQSAEMRDSLVTALNGVGQVLDKRIDQSVARVAGSETLKIGHADA
jgi:hypothetical protein